jgi:hypothetical protein
MNIRQASSTAGGANSTTSAPLAAKAAAASATARACARPGASSPSCRHTPIRNSATRTRRQSPSGGEMTSKPGGSAADRSDSAKPRSSTRRAIGPGWTHSTDQLGAHQWPSIESRRPLGLRPHTPQSLAGRRMLPPPSLPSPSGEPPTARIAASPPLEPPGARAAFQGLFVRP